MASDSPWAMMAPVLMIRWANAVSIISQSTRPILATVMAPETVTTMVQSGSSAMAERTSKASPNSRPPKAVFDIRRNMSANPAAAANVERLQRLEPVVAAVVQVSRHGIISGHPVRPVKGVPACKG